ncbi:TetR family transcriptional regulator [Streptomyces sp. NPDC052309]|uniref:TetR family transcriptional regulator n=1 Tax=Streptomyces sp. NPDC052309 TaxID=3155421 RepID=UPI003431520A
MSTVPGADDRTAALIRAAAVEAMAANGYFGTSVRDIAARAGLSPGAMYHHFSDKHALLADILDRGMDRLLRATEEALYAADNHPAERLRAIVSVHVRMHMDRQAESFLGNTELRSLESGARELVLSKRDAQQRMFDRVVADGTRQGLFATRHPREAARWIVAACTSVATWYRPAGELSPEQIVTRYQAIALDTVGYRSEDR